MTQDRDDILTSEEPLLNIGAVSRMTNIPETTLRVWERRYNFPQSARTAGGHRLYSHQEVLRLQWVKSRLDEGMQISQSIHALYTLEEEERLYTSAQNKRVSGGLTGQEHLNQYRKNLFHLLINYDTEQSNQLLLEIFMLYPLETLLFEVIIPIFEEIGDAWSRGDITVATEHYASNQLRSHLAMWLRTMPPAYAVDPVILACAPGELHEGALLILNLLLRRLRWPVLYLGQNMVLEELNKFTDSFRNPIVVFSASTKQTACTLYEWLKHPHQYDLRDDVDICYGGRGFNENPELIDTDRGVFLGETLSDAVEMLNRYLHKINPDLV